MSHFTSRTLLAASLVLTAWLSACGSGNNSAPAPVEPPNVPGTQVPVAATQDAAAAQAFVAGIVATGEANTETPLALGDAVLATSDAADPVPLGA